jgi:outer membrane protein OmpA-like peptidoglycan-associated protein/uncharacterized protein YidB (DUF937 family)
MFDALINDIASRFGLSANAAPLIREVLGLMTSSPGGLSGFLNALKSAGLSSEVTSWLGQANPAPLAAQQIDRALGSSALGAIANRLGLSSAIVSTAVGYALPKLVGLLTPGGVVPASLPAEVTNFLSPAVHRVDTTVRTMPAAAVATAQVAPRRIDVYHAPPAHDEPVMTSWLWPLLGALAVLGLALLLWPSGNRTTVTPQQAAQAPAVTPAPQPTTAPPRLALTNDDGVIHVSGAVHDEETKASILNALKAVFGADKVQGDVAVDLNRGAAPWMVNFRNAVESLKTPGVQAVFDGNSVNLGGVIGDADRDRIAASLKSVLGSGLVFGTLADKVADMVAGANSKAAAALASLKPGFSANDVIAALNESVINFPSGGAEIPGSMAAFLQKAADGLKQIPKGAQLEIAAYTDNTGDPATNVALSQQRADAVRNALIKAGVDPDMLVAKGYGSANPVGSNDLLEGRLRNRRIEYHLVKT